MKKILEYVICLTKKSLKYYTAFNAINANEFWLIIFNNFNFSCKLNLNNIIKKYRYKFN